MTVWADDIAVSHVLKLMEFILKCIITLEKEQWTPHLNEHIGNGYSWV